MHAAATGIGRHVDRGDQGVSGTVDVDLRSVAPLDAMIAIAQAHGASVEVAGRMVIVRNAH